MRKRAKLNRIILQVFLLMVFITKASRDTTLPKIGAVVDILKKQVHDSVSLKEGEVYFLIKEGSDKHECTSPVSKGKVYLKCEALEDEVSSLSFATRRDFQYDGWYQGGLGYVLNFPDIELIPEGKMEVKKGWRNYPEIINKRYQEIYTQKGQIGKYTYAHTETHSHKTLYSYKEEMNHVTLVGKWDRKFDREVSIKGSYASYYETGVKRSRNQYEIMVYTHLFNHSVKDAVEAEVEVTMFGTYTKWYENGKKYFEVEYDEQHLKNYITNEVKHQNEVSGEGKLTGKYTSWHRNGQVMCEGRLKNGRRTGVWKYYDFDGVLEEEYEYKNGKLTGNYFAYFPSGEKRIKETYYNNKKTGMAFTYHSNGNIASKYEYHKGLKYGVYQEFSRDGKITLNGFYRRDLKVDKWESFYSNGQLKQQEFYADNLKEGTRTKFYPTGEKWSEVQFQNDKEKGNFIAWFKDGMKKVAGQYHFGMKNGSWNKWFKNGQVQETINYALVDNPGDSSLTKYYFEKKFYSEKSLRNGYWVIFHENGKKSFEGNFTNGRLDGEQKYYNVNGVVTQKCTYVAGEKIGEFQEYYKDGVLKQKGYYKDPVTYVLQEYYYKNGDASVMEGIGSVVIQKGDYKSEVKYENGVPQGVWLSWFPNGQVRERGTYTNGVETGPFEEFDQEGKLLLKGDYKNGLEHGIWQIHYESGVLAEKGEFDEGEKVGVWTYYYENGAIKEEIEHLLDGSTKVVSFWDIKGYQKVIDGKGEYYDIDDTGVKIKGQVVDGIKEGMWSMRYPLADVDYIVYFENGKKI